MKPIKKIFTMFITAITFFAYKKDLMGGTGCSIAFVNSYTRESCYEGYYNPDTPPRGCTKCPDVGTTYGTHEYYQGYVSCQPCTNAMIVSGWCDYLGQINTFGMNLWMIYATAPTYININSCFLPAGTEFIDLTGRGIYKGKPVGIGSSVTYPGGSCYYSP